MSLNLLLTWVSARGCGSWSQFRAAVEELHVEYEEGEEDGEGSTVDDLPIYQAVRLTLQRLGHVEFYSSNTESDWHVVPPSLAVHARGDQWVGILCGARPPRIRDQIGQGTAISEVQEASGMPDCIRVVTTDLAALQAAAKIAGVRIQVDAPTSLLAAIPPVGDPRTRTEDKAPEVPGWTIERFVSSALYWTTRDNTDARNLEFQDVMRCQTGLFRFRMKYQRLHFLRWRGRTYCVPVQVGKYAILHHRRVRGVLRYDRSRAVLSVPVSCRPPLLIERALVLCTGLLPALDKSTRRLEYAVPQEIARLAAGLLRQELDLQ